MSELKDVNSGVPSSDAPSSAPTPPPGDNGEFVPETDETGNFQPVPYDRFKEVNEGYRQSRSVAETAQHELQLVQSLADQQAKQLEQYSTAFTQMQAHMQQQQAAPPPPWQEPQSPYPQQGQPYYDPYAEPPDPQTQQIQSLQQQVQQQSKQLEQYQHNFQSFRQEQTAKSIEHQISGDVDVAVTEFPHANRYEIHNEMLRSGKHDGGTIRIFAKKSHEGQLDKNREWAAGQGYSPPARPLLSSGPPAAQPQDFGDDLEAATEAAIARLSTS